jgi:hypothetical protein
MKKLWLSVLVLCTSISFGVLIYLLYNFVMVLQTL